MNENIDQQPQPIESAIKQLALDLLHNQICTAVSFGHSNPEPEDSITFLDNVDVPSGDETTARELIGAQVVFFVLRGSFKLLGVVVVMDIKQVNAAIEYALQQPTVTLITERKFLLSPGDGSPGTLVGTERSSLTLSTEYVECYTLPVEVLVPSWADQIKGKEGVVYGVQNVADGTVGDFVPSKDQIH